MIGLPSETPAQSNSRAGINRRTAVDEIWQPVVMYQVMVAEESPPGPLALRARLIAKNEENQGDRLYERHD
jgi:hypothetical protein